MAVLRDIKEKYFDIMMSSDEQDEKLTDLWKNMYQSKKPLLQHELQEQKKELGQVAFPNSPLSVKQTHNPLSNVNKQYNQLFFQDQKLYNTNTINKQNILQTRKQSLKKYKDNKENQKKIQALLDSLQKVQNQNIALSQQHQTQKVAHCLMVSQNEQLKKQLKGKQELIIKLRSDIQKMKQMNQLANKATQYKRQNQALKLMKQKFEINTENYLNMRQTFEQISLENRQLKTDLKRLYDLLRKNDQYKDFCIENADLSLSYLKTIRKQRNKHCKCLQGTKQLEYWIPRNGIMYFQQLQKKYNQKISRNLFQQLAFGLHRLYTQRANLKLKQMKVQHNREIIRSRRANYSSLGYQQVEFKKRKRNKSHKNKNSRRTDNSMSRYLGSINIQDQSKLENSFIRVQGQQKMQMFCKIWGDLWIRYHKGMQKLLYVNVQLNKMKILKLMSWLQQSVQNVLKEYK